MLAVNVTVSDVSAKSVIVSAELAVTVMVCTSGALMNTLVAAVVTVRTFTCAASTTAVLTKFVIVTTVPLGALTRSDC